MHYMFQKFIPLLGPVRGLCLEKEDLWTHIIYHKNEKKKGRTKLCQGEGEV
jgi:hypothetical protein